MDLTGKHVVVTGAGRGIGEALARRFHVAGATVTIADLTGAEEVARSIGGHAVGVTADVSTDEGNRELIEAAVSAFGPVDLFFANAGVAIGTDLSTDEDIWATAFAVNVHAHRWAAKHLLPAWLERGDGYFCSTASAAGLLAQIGSAPYTLTKRAAVAFAEWLAITYGDQGIKVSCLCPQGVNTAMLQQTTEGDSSPADVVRLAGAVLEPDEVADIVHTGIVEERFLILPHPEVHRYVQNKAADADRWLAGMRRLQAHVRDS